MEVVITLNEDEIRSLKEDVTDLKIRMKVAETNIETVTKSVTDIKNNTSKLVWLVGSALVLTILNLIIKGGLKI
jgi:hypothetical protein